MVKREKWNAISRLALSEVVQSLSRLSTIGVFSASENGSEFNEFVMALHSIPLQTCIFNEMEEFFDFIESQLNGSLRVTAFIFHHPHGLVERVSWISLIFISYSLLRRRSLVPAVCPKFFVIALQIHTKNLAHRLCLFIFYWGACELPEELHKRSSALREPLRTIMITRPQIFIFDVFYNQVSSTDHGIMEFVNRYDGNNLGWQNDTLLVTRVENNYENLNQRLMVVPVTHVSSFRPAVSDDDNFAIYFIQHVAFVSCSVVLCVCHFAVYGMNSLGWLQSCVVVVVSMFCVNQLVAICSAHLLIWDRQMGQSCLIPIR